MGAARRARAGRKPAAPAPVSRHVEAFLEMLAAERGAAALTLIAYKTDLADLATALGDTAIEAAATEDLRHYLARLAKARLAPRTAARRLSALRQFYRFLVLEGVRKDDPTAALDTPRLGRPLP
ncbi:MAG TPA: site-specific integrase, partial [Stellaceae bacterium]